ncbi:MAG TPA: large conductance mechanosensitive channel protein MscL [Aquirhabdus sp.]
MSIVQEFKTFAVKGNMIDLAVGVIIGAAFGKIIDSLVNDMIIPIISFILGGKVDFSKLFFVLGDNPLNLATLDALKKADIAVLAYGNFITIMINFLLLAIVVFIMVKAVNKMRQAEPAPAPAATPEDVALLREIRDELRRRP